MDENAETLAKKLADAVMEIPGRSVISHSTGVKVGRAQEYRESLKMRLDILARMVTEVSDSVVEFSDASAAAVASIRAADAQAEEDTLAILQTLAQQSSGRSAGATS
ncbi:hypothetical protein [Mycetocola lacteus]|uniref:hypothetical protein n=1 Tax=Mycetocola lacteus TaxID=76637 RepID=UPI0011C443FF|nr:hypothetical protein [Mycetocola lacteus]